MANKTRTMWGIHAGSMGDADELFREKSLVALGWDKTGDLSNLAKTREAFKKIVSEAYFDLKPGALPGLTGQLFRFVCEMQVGDIVVYPSKIDRQVHIGKVEGQYEYVAKFSTGYFHRRKVQWLKSVSRASISQGARYEIGSAISFFQVKNYADEFMIKLDGQANQLPDEVDPTIIQVAEDIEENTVDFVIKILAKELKGHPFEGFVAHILSCLGYRCRVTSGGPDGGIDIIAHRDVLGFEPPIIKIQVKSSEGSVGQPDVSSLYGNIGAGEFGMFVTLGSFTAQATNYAKSKTNLRLISGVELVELILQHYEMLDSRYKSLIPLRRVYIPQSNGLEVL